MRIAILAAALVAAPVVADAATYRLSYEGTATFREFLEPDAPFLPVSDPPPLTFALMIDIPDGGGTYESGFEDYGVRPFGDPLRLESISFFPAPSAIESGFSSARFFAEVDADGNLERASAEFNDQNEATFLANQGSYTVAEFRSGVLYDGPGEFTLTSLDEPAPVPLPATAPLVLLGLAGLGWARRRS